MADLRSILDALDERRKAAAGVPMRPGEAPVTLPTGEQMTAVPKPEGMTPRDVGIGAAGMMVDPAIQAGESAGRLYRGEGDWKENLGGALGHGAEFLAGVTPVGRAEAVAGKVVPRVAKAVEEAAPLVGGAIKKAVPWAFSPEGMAEFGGKKARTAYDRAAGKTWQQVMEEGAGPLDLSSQEAVPGTKQFDLPRYEPPRGVSPRLQKALARPELIEGIRDSIRAGMNIGAHRWYNTEPIRQAFVGQLGEDQGDLMFRRYMSLASATSPQSRVPENIRNASYYYHLMRQDKPTPIWGQDKLPPLYGGKGQKLHMQNVANLREGGWQYDPLQNPKPASFAENLSGNLEPGTIDTHAFRNISMRTRDPDFLLPSYTEKVDKGKELSNFQKMFGEAKIDKKGNTIVTIRPRDLHDSGRLSMDEIANEPTFWASKPNPNEYKAAEKLYKDLAKEFGLTPAAAQAAAWAGAARMTGMDSPVDKTFTELFNSRVEHTARMRGEHPQETLRAFIAGEKPLLQLGAAAAGTTALGAAATRGRETNPAKGDTGGGT